MEIKEAIGYLQAVADNAQNTPKYQRALEQAIHCMECHETLADQNKRLVDRNSELTDKCSELERELRDERDRFDKLTSFELEEAKELEELRARIAGLEK
jgi:predicted RNase H-like nuclease (RuvC/YqgF family)